MSWASRPAELQSRAHRVHAGTGSCVRPRQDGQHRHHSAQAEALAALQGQPQRDAGQVIALHARQLAAARAGSVSCEGRKGSSVSDPGAAGEARPRAAGCWAVLLRAALGRQASGPLRVVEPRAGCARSKRTCCCAGRGRLRTLPASRTAAWQPGWGPATAAGGCLESGRR